MRGAGVWLLAGALSAVWGVGISYVLPSPLAIASSLAVGSALGYAARLYLQRPQ